MEAQLLTTLGNCKQMIVTSIDTDTEYAAGEVIVIGNVVGFFVAPCGGANKVAAAALIGKRLDSQGTFILSAEQVRIAKPNDLQIDQGDRVYWDAEDNQVNKTAAGNTYCGICIKNAAATDTTVDVFFEGASTADAELASDLASTTNAKGASLVAIEDAAGLITATSVEGALAELAPSAATIAATGACSAANFLKGCILATCAAATDIVLPATGVPVGRKCTFIKTAGSTNELKLSATALIGPGSTANEATGADAVGDSYTVMCIADDSYVITAKNIA
jgi:predicted RecA/RadA family phage recombinase